MMAKDEVIRRVLVMMPAIWFCVLGVCAQDVITKKDGTGIEGRVVEVSRSEVKYKKASNPEGPMYVLLISEISKIRYQDGEEDVFADAGTDSVSTNMDYKPVPKYSELRKQYNCRGYSYSTNDRYTPVGLGFASFLVPGLGQALCNEWGSAVCFYLSETVCTCSGSILMSYDCYGLAIGAYALAIVVDVLAAVDASHMAKVKNLYYRDREAKMAAIDVHLEPNIAMVPAGIGDEELSLGLSLKVNF